MPGTPTLRAKYRDLRTKIKSIGMVPETLEGSGKNPDDDTWWAVVEDAGGAGGTREEVEALLGLEGEELDKAVEERCGLSYVRWSERHLARARTRLRAAQLKVALSGDRALLIWLGKILLSQKDQAGSGGAAPVQVLGMPKSGALELKDRSTSVIVKPDPQDE